MRRTQRDRTAETKAALLAAARELFSERGYHDVNLEEIVRHAGVTRGALYHHHASKRALFQAVFESLESEMALDLESLMADAPSVASGLEQVLAAYLDFCQRPDARRICLVDGPGVLGWETWKQLEARHGVGLIAEWLEALSDETGIAMPAPPALLAPLLISAVAEAGLTIASAEDPGATRTAIEPALQHLLAGLFANH